jgi:ankyrin repeat protein
MLTLGAISTAALIAMAAPFVTSWFHEQSMPLYEAAAQHKEIVQLLLAAGADVHAEERSDRFSPGGTVLIAAASEPNSEEIVRLLVDAGADVDACTAGGSTALMMAAERGDKDVVLALLAAGADPDVVTKDVRTASTTLMKYNRGPLVNEILEILSGTNSVAGP